MKDSAEPVLVVDLDGTLLWSDLLVESFWSAFGRDWRSPFWSLAALLSGRAAVKRYLSQVALLDATTLPYDPQVIAYVEAWRSHGGRTALVTASDQSMAVQVADHLALFDEVYGSDGHLNLKGAAKADFLSDHFGANGYCQAVLAGSDQSS